MFYSHCLLSRKGPLGSIWVAAYYFKKLKKAEVNSTDISSSVDKILRDGFDVITYRVLAYLLLGVVRIYSKKVEYLFDDCNKVLLNVKDFMVSDKDRILMETLRSPHFSITLPERFELDAFDLEILEDFTTEGNVMPHEEITLKDGMWKTGGVGKYSLNQDHCWEFAACQDTWSADYSLNEDVFSSHTVDVDMEQGTSHSVSILQASMEKLRGNMFSPLELEDLEMFPEVEEEPPDARKSSVDDHQTDEEHSKVPDKIGSDETDVGASVLKDDGVGQEAYLNLETFGGIEEEPGNLAELYHQPKEQQKEVPGLEQSENEVHNVFNDGNVSDVEASIEKLLENRFFQEERMDTNIFFAVEDPPEHPRLFNEEHQSDVEKTKVLEATTLGKRKRQLVLEDHPLSIKLDTTPQPKSKDISGSNTPEFMVISTPAAKERARILSKRKCLFDDVIVFPNNVIKECIEDSSDLVSKRRKLPHTAFAVWKACRLSTVGRCFLEPLIPCTSLELRSLFCRKRLQIPETVESVGVSVETEEPSKKLDASESQNVGMSEETMERLENINISGSPLVGRLDETVEPPKNMSIQESAGTVESPQTFVSECPATDRLAETVEPSDMSESCIVGRSVEIVEPLEKPNVSGSPSACRFSETLEQPGKLDVAESPTAGGSLEQMAIAPETPIRYTTSLRSFESPERPDISETDGLRSECVEKEIFPSMYEELDLNLLNGEINTSEEDNQEYYGWSERTRVAVKCLNASFLIQKKRRREEVVNLLRLLEGTTKKESARLFYEILVLKSKGYVDVKQDNFYGEILVSQTSQWDQACGL